MRICSYWCLPFIYKCGPHTLDLQPLVHCHCHCISGRIWFWWDSLRRVYISLKHFKRLSLTYVLITPKIMRVSCVQLSFCMCRQTCNLWYPSPYQLLHSLLLYISYMTCIIFYFTSGYCRKQNYAYDSINEYIRKVFKHQDKRTDHIYICMPHLTRKSRVPLLDRPLSVWVVTYHRLNC